MLRSRPAPRAAFAALLLFGLSVAGCDSTLDTEAFNVQTIESQLATPEGAVPFVNSVYQPLPALYGSNGAAMASVLESGTDDGWPFAQFLDGMKARSIDASQGQFGAIWGTSLSNGIGRANYYLFFEPDIDFAGREELGEQLRGEVYFLRAFYYFNLVRLFGEVPIYDETDLVNEISEAQRPRDPVPEVYEFIKADLRRATDLLPSEYSDTGLGQELGRATSGAARTLLAKVHLTLEEWNEVLDVTDGLGALYSLRADYADNFYGLDMNSAGENQVESIFEVQFSALGDGPQSQLRVSYAPRGIRDGQNQIIPTDDRYLDGTPGADGPNGIFQAFEEGDARFESTLNQYGPDNPPQTNSFPLRDENGEIVRDDEGNIVLDREWFVFKWWSDVGNDATAWNIPVFRYAEVLLMRAEAFAELGQAGEAIALVNEIRARAELPALAAGSQQEAIDAVRQERRVEFAFEHKRLFDLNRWGILAEVLAPQGVTIDPAKVTAHPITGEPQVLYPIPLSELQRNPNATQNQGY
jgi:hypothetical protein